MSLRDIHERVRFMRKRQSPEADLDEEIAFHLSEETEERVAEGKNPDQARLDARRDFGNVAFVREAVREVWGTGSTDRLLQDLRFGLRSMWRHAGFSVLAVLTLALGIGANTAMFSLVNAILLRPLPYEDPDRLVSVTATYPRGAFVELRAGAQTIQVAAYADGHEFTMTGMGEPIRLTTTFVSAELLSVLGARPRFGRRFATGEDTAGQDSYVILGSALWEERFASDPAIIGRALTLDGISRQVVGVMPPDFRFPSAKTQIWIPLHVDRRVPSTYWAGDFMPVVGRLQPGVTFDQARAEMRRFQDHAPSLFPWAMPASWNANLNVVPLQTALVGEAERQLLLLLAVVGVVLLIACANVANLSLARAASRAKEISVRFALGAGQARIARQLLTESVLLAIAGGLAGLLVAIEAIALLKRILPPDTPRIADVNLDWRVLAFTAVVAVVTGLAFGIAPSLQASRGSLAGSLRSGGRNPTASVSRPLRSALVVAQIAFAVLLVTAAGLLVRSFWMLTHSDAGFRPERAVTARITPSQTFCTPEERCLAFYRQVLDRLRASPGVNSAALVNTLPLDGRVAKRSLNLEGRPTTGADGSPLFWLNVVTPDYFRVMGIPLVSGRAFTDADFSASPPVAIIPRTTARRFWTEGTAIGRQVRFVGEDQWRTVIGVVGDVRAHDLRQDVPGYIVGTVYVPYDPRATLEGGQIPTAMTIAAVTTEDVQRFDRSLRQVVAGLSPETPITDVQTMRENIAEAVASPASVATAFAVFAGLALVLGAVGIYGVISYLVSTRVGEIGLRLALGARRFDVFRLIMKEGAALAFAGIVVGMGAAAGATRLLSRELYGVTAADPVTYLAVAILMALVTLAACFVPTYRAMRISPLIALNSRTSTS